MLKYILLLTRRFEVPDALEHIYFLWKTFFPASLAKDDKSVMAR